MLRNGAGSASITFEPILDVLALLSRLTDRYSNLLNRCLGGASVLSAQTLKHVVGRVKATVDRCGGTQIADDLVQQIAHNPSLRLDLFGHFFSSKGKGKATNVIY